MKRNKIEKGIEPFHIRRRKYFPAGVAFILPLMLLMSLSLFAQDTSHISLQEAIAMGLDSSKQLKLSQAKIQEAISGIEQAKDHRLPQIKASYMVSEAFIPTRTLQIEGLMKKPMKLPSTSMIYLGTFGVNEAIFAGNKLRYAEQSAELLKKMAGLNAAHDKKGIILNVIRSYINLYKIDENLKIISQNLQDVQGRLEETNKFKDQGLATLNDVLRFQLQKSKVVLTQIDLQNNRAVANYAMDILLGLPDETYVKVDSIGLTTDQVPALQELIQQAMRNRADLAAYKYQDQLSSIAIKNIKADNLPTVGAGLTTYYLNPTKKFFPAKNSFLIPVTLGLNINWNISNLYTSRHKIDEAQIKQQEVMIAESATSDKIKMEVNKDYHAYLQSLQHIDVLKTAVKQAKENDRIMELKYQNQLATTTDRIDAQTLLYQSLVNLALARADAAVDYYQLLQTTGRLGASVK